MPEALENLHLYMQWASTSFAGCSATENRQRILTLRRSEDVNDDDRAYFDKLLNGLDIWEVRQP